MTRSRTQPTRPRAPQDAPPIVEAASAVTRELVAPDDTRALLQRAVDEVARLLSTDGAMAYLVDPADDMLHFAVDAGIRNAEARNLIRDLSLPIGVGLFGTTAARREVVVTGDYRRDSRFTHSPVADRIVQVTNMRSMVAAPLVAGGEVLGAMGAYSTSLDAFDEAGIALLRALADHAAAAIWNRRLIERLNRSQQELARRVEAERTLGVIAARIATIHVPDDVLQEAVDAARRLLESDSAHITILDTDSGVLRPTVVAGTTDPEIRAWLQSLEFPINGGINGLAAGRREVIWTEDYLVDPRIPHEPSDQEVAQQMGLRGMAAAPLRAPGGAVIGTLAVSFAQPRLFSDHELNLLQGLADQGAIAIANARLYREAEVSAEKLARQVETQRTLADIAAQITSLRDPIAVLERAIAEAKRLLGADHVLIHRLRPGTRELPDFVEDMRRRPEGMPVDDAGALVGQGVAGKAVESATTAWTGDYLTDPGFVHTTAADDWIRRHGYRSQLSAPLVREGSALGAISAYSARPDAFGETEAETLSALASHAAIVLGNADLYERLEQRIEAQHTLGEIATRITAIREPGDVLQRTLDEAVRLLEADGGRIELIDERGGLNWAFGHSAIDLPIEHADEGDGIRPAGVSAKAVRERRVVVTGDYLADASFEHGEASDRYIRQFGIRSVMSAALIGEDGAIGSLTVHSQARDAFDDEDIELLSVLAAQAAIAVTNARLYRQLRERVEAQKALAEIAAQLTALREPGAVLSQTADAAMRLLGADAAVINPLDTGAGHLDWPVAYAPAGGPVDDVLVTIGQGVSGRSVAERRVVLTGDYLADESFIHTPELDEYIKRRGMRSVMSAPLEGPSGGMGALTVQSARANAFDADDAELLELLANQAAIAITNTRLYDELQSSESRYRFLVDNSPDMIWALDDEGRFTFVSEAVERIFGIPPAEAIGRHWRELTDEESFDAAQERWEQMHANPSVEHQLRITALRPDGQRVPVDIHMVATTIDGRFAGVHGSLRDISERVRLEEDLRRQAAELAASGERAHLARELHDSVTQAVFSIGLTLRALELQLQTDPEAARAKISELRELQRDALAEMRTLIFELRPASLETDGLVQALRTHAAAVQGRTGLAISLDAEQMDRLPLPVEEALYRIGQEAVHNIVKHANAQRATIRLARDGERVRLSIEDDGEGFDPDAVPRGHLGLIGMRQRADLVGVELIVRSQPGRGTRVEIRVPPDLARSEATQPELASVN